MATALDVTERPFERPTTNFNRAVERLLRLFPSRPLERADVESLQARAVQTFIELGAAPAVLKRAVTRTPWELSPEEAPSDAWGGEVLMRSDGRPSRVVIYGRSPLTRLPSRRILRLASQLTVDHMLGHLYEYHCGAADWGEEPACRWQYRVLRRRGGLVNDLTAAIMVLTHRLHKDIPISNYG
jgi:hypothetical protein